MKKTFYSFVIFLFLLLSCHSKNDKEKDAVIENKSLTISKREIKNYSIYYQEAKRYCRKNNLNQNIFILIDLSLHSGFKRFFVYDFKAKTITDSLMVSDGCGNAPWGETTTKEKAQVSNVPDSHCSSIGKYIVKKRGISQWGIKVNYLLEGKEATNSNAMNRAIVLHSWEAVPNNPVHPAGTPEGWGCPAVSNPGMRIIDAKLQNNKKVLLWVVQSKK